MCRTHPQLRIAVEITPNERAMDLRATKIEWIYTRTKASGPDSLELALIANEKERMRNGLFFKHLVLACTIVLMSDLGLARCTICWRF